MAPPRPADTYSLVADIGGTNTRVALAEGPQVLPETVRRFRNAEHPDLESVLRAYVAAEGGVDCIGACVAVAGPVRDDVAQMTNLDWRMDKATLARATGAETAALLNDLQAQGHALGRIDAANLRQIVPQPAAEDSAAQLVIGIGTGFNIAPVYNTPHGRHVAASEAGHAGLAVRDETDLSLAHFVEKAHGFPETEEVLSGRGLERVYAWLGEREGDPRAASAAEIMAALGAGSDPRAGAAARVFAEKLGAVAGNLALITLPYGGIYLSGGVARAFAPYLAEFGFAGAFRDKGRFSGLMDSFGVAVIEDDFAALTGCASYLAALT